MSWLVSVNPMSPYVGSLPILVAVTFIDMLGYRHALNQTAIVFVEGIVEISLMDTSISPETPYSDGSLTISTTILNLGTYKAKNVEAYLNSSALQSNGSYSFVGDVDVGAQVPISISATLRNVTGNKTVYLTIEYRDIFNEPVTLTFPMNITVSESPPQSPVRSATLLEDYYKIAFFIALILFMLGSGYILYRMYQKTKRKSQGMNT